MGLWKHLATLITRGDRSYMWLFAGAGASRLQGQRKGQEANGRLQGSRPLIFRRAASANEGSEVRGTTRAQPVVGCEMRMGREPKKRMDGKMWKKHNKTRGKKLNQHAQSSKYDEK